jgi:hypothetical protein
MNRLSVLMSGYGVGSVSSVQHQFQVVSGCFRMSQGVLGSVVYDHGALPSAVTSRNSLYTVERGGVELQDSPRVS